MMEKQNKNSCLNCKYFVQHYVLESALRFKPLYCGHCAKSDKCKKQKGFPKDYVCDSWAHNEHKVEDKIKSIKDILNHMNNRLTEIEEYLAMLANFSDE